ncbi:MAG: glycosyltransferase [Oscillospiraceae bacterium]|nr:glycosyltransferase [Oscillospiraceae bacterium]
MKKLFLLTDSFPFGKGEATFLCAELPYLQQHFDITIISKNITDEQTTPLPDSIRVLRANTVLNLGDKLKGLICAPFTPMVWKELGWLKKHNTFSCKNVWYALMYFFSGQKLYRFLKKNLPLTKQTQGVCYSYWYNYNILSVLSHKKKYPNLRFVTRTHRYDLYQTPLIPYQPYKAQMDALLDRVVFISKQGRDYYNDTFVPYNLQKHLVCYLGVDNNITNPPVPSDSLRIISVSHMVPVKRVTLIAQALALIGDIPVVWHHIGDGPLGDETRKEAATLLADKPNISYTFLGAMPGSEVRSTMTQHPYDVFLNVSSSEGLPVSIMEAMSFGLPVIATDVGGTREIVNEDNGILLGSDPTPQQIAQALCSLHQLPATKKRNAAYATWQKGFVAAKNYDNFAQMLKSL